MIGEGWSQQRLFKPLPLALQGYEYKLLLGREEMIKTAFGHARSHAQLIHGHRFVAVRVNHLVCSRNQPLPGIARSSHGLLLRHSSVVCGLCSTKYHEGEQMSRVLQHQNPSFKAVSAVLTVLEASNSIVLLIIIVISKMISSALLSQSLRSYCTVAFLALILVNK